MHPMLFMDFHSKSRCLTGKLTIFMDCFLGANCSMTMMFIDSHGFSWIFMDFIHGFLSTMVFLDMSSFPSSNSRPSRCTAISWSSCVTRGRQRQSRARPLELPEESRILMRSMCVCVCILSIHTYTYTYMYIYIYIYIHTFELYRYVEIRSYTH